MRVHTSRGRAYIMAMLLYVRVTSTDTHPSRAVTVGFGEVEQTTAQLISETLQIKLLDQLMEQVFTFSTRELPPTRKERPVLYIQVECTAEFWVDPICAVVLSVRTQLTPSPPPA